MFRSKLESENLTIREMTVRDRISWADMYSHLFSRASRTGMFQEIDRILNNPKRAGYCAEFKGRMIGFAEMNFRDFANGCSSKPVPFLEGIWVHPEFRKNGVASALFAHIEQVAKGAGYSEIGSEVLFENLSSIEVHKRFGFEETERVVCFRKDV